VWRSGRVSDCKPESLGSCPSSAAFETFQLCRKSSIFIVKFSAGMSENFFDTCVNWSCVTRCGCRTTSSTLFTVKKLEIPVAVNGSNFGKTIFSIKKFGLA
jgi:hypothetical protein